MLHMSASPGRPRPPLYFGACYHWFTSNELVHSTAEHLLVTSCRAPLSPYGVNEVLIHGKARASRCNCYIAKEHALWLHAHRGSECTPANVAEYEMTVDANKLRK